MASFGVSPLDAERRRLERRRALVDILQKQAMAGPQAPTMPGAQMSPYQGLAKMGEALIAALANRAQEKREKAFAGEEQKQALKTGEDIAGMLIAQSPDLGKPIDVNAPLPQAQATPMYAPQQQVSLAGTDQQVTLPPALSAAESEAMASMAPGLSIPDLRSSFASQQAQVAREKPQLDAARNALARTIAGGGAPAQFAIANQQALNQRALDVAEQKRREGVLAERQAVEDAIRESQFIRERSAQESRDAAARAIQEAELAQRRQQFQEKSLQDQQQFKTQIDLENKKLLFSQIEANKQREVNDRLQKAELSYKANESKLDRQNRLMIAQLGSAGTSIPANIQLNALNSYENSMLAKQALDLLKTQKGVEGMSLSEILKPQGMKSEDAVEFQSIIGKLNSREVRNVAGKAQNLNEMQNINMYLPQITTGLLGAKSDSVGSAIVKLQRLYNDELSTLDTYKNTYGFVPGGLQSQPSSQLPSQPVPAGNTRRIPTYNLQTGELE